MVFENERLQGGERVKVGADDLDTFTTLESNKSLTRILVIPLLLATPLGPGRHRVQFCTSASGIAGDLPSANPWSKVAAAYSCDGSGADRSYMDLGRAIVIPHSTIGRLNL
jgi:hypothetical protein